jgi:hypothetical protein
MVWTRVFLMRRAGIGAMHFGRIDRTDFLIPPFALFYFYPVFAAAFDLPWSAPSGSSTPRPLPGSASASASPA